MRGFRKGGFSNNKLVLKPDVAIASEVSILSKNSLSIADFHAKKTQLVQLFEKTLFLEPPHSIFQGFRSVRLVQKNTRILAYNLKSP